MRLYTFNSILERGFKGEALQLDDVDLPRIGHKIGVGEDELHAFMDVEAAGDGFDSQGRPKMLFEPHVFYRNLSGEQGIRAARAGLAYKNWGTKRYPKDSYPRLMEACKINPEAALKSSSWGLGQILGENFAMVGYDTVFDMVWDFMQDEEHHLEAIVEFLISAGIDDDLRAHRWDVVARVYNGPAYAKHNYHGRMAKAFTRWQGIKDTPWHPRMDEEQKPTTKPRNNKPPMVVTKPTTTKEPATDTSGLMVVLGVIGAAIASVWDYISGVAGCIF